MQPHLIPIILPLAFFAVYALAGGVLLSERKRGRQPAELIALRGSLPYTFPAAQTGNGTVPFLAAGGHRIGSVPEIHRPTKAGTILSSADRGGRVFVSWRTGKGACPLFPSRAGNKGSQREGGCA